MFLPAGSRDEMGSIVENRFFIKETFRKVANMRGYHFISTPIVEYATTFTNEYVDMKLQHMMKWFNAEGEIEVLRPDWTIAIARALSQREKTPQKWAYMGSVFNLAKTGIESQQIGVEILHFPSIWGESECLFLAKEFLEQIGIYQCYMELGHTEIYERLASKLNLTKQEQIRLRQAMHDKKKDEVYHIAKTSGNEQLAMELADLVDAYGPISVLEEYEKRWKDSDELYPILQSLKEVATVFQNDYDVLIDLGRVKNLPYYSGTLFRGFLKETGEECFSGGRYDRLYEQFGEPFSAVGLAFDVDLLAQIISPPTEMTRICVIADKHTFLYGEKLRKQYKNAIVDVTTEIDSTKTYDRIVKIVERNGQIEVMDI